MLTKFLIKKPCLITFIHWSFIIFSFLFAIFTPFYLGLAMIILHAAHEKYFGGCYLTLLGRKAGQIKKDEDFFHYFFRSVNLELSSKITTQISNFIKTIILLIVIYNLFVFLGWFNF